MTACSDLAEYEWLTSSEAAAILKELAANNGPIHTTIARLRVRFTSTRTHLLMEQAELRRKASAKFSQSHRMFFTRIGLEQATDEWVAGYKATRFAALGERWRGSPGGSPAIADVCCGIGGDLWALAKGGQSIGIDHDPVAAHFAAINTGTCVRTVDVADFDFDGVAAWHIDPDRRPGGRRTTSLEWCEPNCDTIEHLLHRVPHAAVKLAPAAEVPADWTARCELEWISRDRECRQLVAWHGDLALATGKCRATVVATKQASRGVPTPCPSFRTIVGEPKQPIPTTVNPDRYVFDLDPAVLAAKLKGALAAEHELHALSTGPTYLTGPRSIADAALACFEVDAVLPFKVRTLAQHLHARDIGQLEIKVRGVEVDPEKLRRKLKPSGNKGATILITHVDDRPMAILARRIPT